MKILTWIIGLLIEELRRAIPDPEHFRIVADDVLDSFEDKHPVLKAAAQKFREEFGIPDDIAGDED